MATNIVQLSPAYFPSSSKGRPLALADIYVGIPDLDPEIVANQKTLSVQQEDGTIVVVSQPISTGAGGVPLYLGSPVTLLVEGNYSLKILDSDGSQIYYVPSVVSQVLVTGNFYYPDYNETDQGAVGDGNSVLDILTEVGAVTKATMYFAHDSGGATTTYVFGTSESITDNFNVIVEDGALISPATAKTVTAPPAFDAGNFQVFSGAGAISFGSTPSMTINTMWFTGVPDGSTSNDTDFQKAIDSAPIGAMLYTPKMANDYILENLTIIRPITWYGDGRGTVLKALSTASGYMIHVNGEDASAERNREGALYGVVIKEMMLSGNERTPDIGALKISRLDHSTFETLWIERFAREALNLYTRVRESTFNNIHTRWNGDGDSSYPDINITEQNVSSADAHNNNVFSKVFSIYTLGDHIYLDSVATVADLKFVRNIRFDNCMIHGLLASQDGAGNNPFDITFSVAQKSGKHLFIGTATNTHVMNTNFSTLGFEQSGVDIDSGSNGDPNHTTMIGNRFEGRYSTAVGADAANDIVIELQKGILTFVGNTIISSGQALANNILTDTDTNLYYAANHLEGTGPTFNGNLKYGEIDDTALMRMDGMNLFDVGDLYAGTTDNNAYTIIKSKTTELSLLGVTTTWNNAILANSVVFGMTCRVTELITGATAFDVGISGGDTDLYLDGIVVALDTTGTLENSNAALVSPVVYQANANVLVTAVGGAANFSAGKVRLTVHYLQLGAPGS